MIEDCDLLVALYPSNDFMTVKGGTAEAMRYARYIHKPMLQIKYVIENGILYVSETVNVL
jgi:hypothetical protein